MTKKNQQDNENNLRKIQLRHGKIPKKTKPNTYTTKKSPAFPPAFPPAAAPAWRRNDALTRNNTVVETINNSIAYLTHQNIRQLKQKNPTTCQTIPEHHSVAWQRSNELEK